MKILINNWFIYNTKKIKPIKTNSCYFTLETIFLHVIKQSKTWLYLNFNNYLQISYYKLIKLQFLINIVIFKFPLEYITEQCFFYSISLKIKPKMFIPRNCTEIIVNQTLQLLQNTFINNSILELGTGTGAISLAINKYCNNKHKIIAIDNDLTSINCAKLNANLLNIKNIKFLLLDWFNKLNFNKKFDLIISNPPYVNINDVFYKYIGNKFECNRTTLSLYNGFNDLFHIIFCSNKFLLKTDGYLILEHGWDQSILIYNFLKNNNFTKIFTLKDSFNHNRVTIGQKI